jgi:hypothetical protein
MNLFGIFQQNGNFWVPGWLFYVSCAVWAVFLLTFVLAVVIAALMILDKRDIPGLVETEPEGDYFPQIDNPKPALKRKPASRRRRKL